MLIIHAVVSFAVSSTNRPGAEDLQNQADAVVDNSSPSRRIIVVDDTRASAFILGRLLELLGHDVAVCYDARSALRAALNEPPEIIFSDIAMPDVDGYEFAQQVRSQPSLSQVKLVALTGYDGENDRKLAYAAGFDHHLVKPVTLEALLSLLS